MSEPDPLALDVLSPEYLTLRRAEAAEAEVALWRQRLDAAVAEHERLMAERSTTINELRGELVALTAEAAAVSGRLTLADPQDTRLLDAVRRARSFLA